MHIIGTKKANINNPDIIKIRNLLFNKINSKKINVLWIRRLLKADLYLFELKNNSKKQNIFISDEAVEDAILTKYFDQFKENLLSGKSFILLSTGIHYKYNFSVDLNNEKEKYLID